MPSCPEFSYGAAQTSSEQTITNQASAENKAALVMELSGSMLDQDVAGSKLDAAKAAATQLVDSLPDTANLGLVVYGQQESNAPDNREAGCKDIQVVSPVGRIDKQKLKSDIAGFSASGYTPIGNSLKVAARELGSTGNRSIILVSDGIDTCAPPPVCEVAKELGGAGYNLTIHTVGFRVDNEARAELQCNADATGGQFLYAGNASELANSMTFLTTRDMAGYQPVGTPFEFADFPEDARWLGEGRYQTTVVPRTNGSDSDPFYYRLAIPENHNAIVSIKAVPNKTPDGVGQQDISFGVSNATNDSSGQCQKFSASDLSSVRSSATSFVPVSGMFGFISVDPSTGNDPSCDQTQWLIENKVFLYESDQKAEFLDEPVAVEVEVQFEPVTPSAELQQLTQGSIGNMQAPLPDIAFSNPKPLTGAPNFATAPEVTSGGVYEDTLVKGEMKYFKVPVEWGQLPVAAVQSASNELREAPAKINVIMTNPAYSRGSGVTVNKPITNGAVVAPDRPINLRNREANAGGLNHSIAGNYYIGVSLSEFEANDIAGVEEPFTLAVKVVGDPLDGPTWRPVEIDGPQPSDDPIWADFAVPTSEEQAADENPADTNSPAAEGAETGTSSTAWGIFAVAIVVALIAAIVGFTLKRKRSGGKDIPQV